MTINQFRWGAVESNPVLPAGEVGINTATGQIKVGNGHDAWTDLPDDTSDTPTTIDGGTP